MFYSPVGKLICLKLTERIENVEWGKYTLENNDNDNNITNRHMVIDNNNNNNFYVTVVINNISSNINYS